MKSEWLNELYYINLVYAGYENPNGAVPCDPYSKPN